MMNRKHFFNERFFDSIDCEEKAYWLGFFFADGSVYKTTFSCTLKSDDDYHLQTFLNTIGASDTKLTYRKTPSDTISVGFFVCSTYLVKQLRKLGFVERKSYINSDFIFTQIPDELKIHFIRGYWDGNGYVKLRQDRFGDIGVVTLNEKLLQAFSEYFNNRSGDQKMTKVFCDKNGYYRIVVCGEKAKTICHWFYDNCTVRLERKYCAFLRFKTYDKNYQGIRQRKNGRYQAYIKMNYVQRSLGTYDTVKEAVNAYNVVAIKHNLHTQEYRGESLKRELEMVV